MRTSVKVRGTIALAIIAFLFLAAGSIARGAGVTVITHGYSGNADGWVNGMAERLVHHPQFPGTNYSRYKLTLTYDGSSYFYQWTFLSGGPLAATDSGELVIDLDWSQLAGGLSAPYDDSTYNVAWLASLVLQQTNAIFGGHAPVELPIHLIGHSRGGSLVNEMSRVLGTNGLWIDHVTTLDPHPFNNDGNFDPGFPTDASAYYTYLNVLFRDNYWQDLGISFLDPNGEEVSGAYNRQLYSLEGGYNDTGSVAPYHGNVHLWYHGTVDQRNPADDTEAQIGNSEFSTWYVSYESYGFNAGFKWSLIGGGVRTSTDRPLGVGYPAIRDGFNQAWDLGAGVTGNRSALPSNSGSWPNIIRFDIIGTNTVSVGSPISMKYFCQFGSSTNQSTNVSVYLDRNENPYDGNSGLIFQRTEFSAGLNALRPATAFSFNTSNTPPGQYYVFAKITFGTRTRYLYAPQKLTINPPPDTTKPTVAITNPPVAKVYTNAQMVSISASASDNIGVTQVEFYDGLTLAGTDTTAPYTLDWSFTDVNNGAHVWTARAYDAAGNVSTSSAVTLTVSIDITLPILSITSPANGTNVTTSPITVSGTASDPGSPSSGLSLVEVRVNGGSWQSASGTTSWSRSVTVAPCQNSIEARSRDGAGNYSVIASNFITFTPANTVPNTPSNLSPANGATNLPITPLLQASAFVDLDCVGDTHVASQWQVLNSAGAVVVADSGTDAVNRVSWTVPATKLYYGSNYQWRVRYQDSRGGWSSYSAQSAFTTGGPMLTETKQGTNVVFKWPTNALGFALQWSTNLAGTINWSNATPAPVIVSGQYTLTNAMTNKARFYRLKK